MKRNGCKKSFSLQNDCPFFFSIFLVLFFLHPSENSTSEHLLRVFSFTLNVLFTNIVLQFIFQFFSDRPIIAAVSYQLTTILWTEKQKKEKLKKQSWWETIEEILCWNRRKSISVRLKIIGAASNCKCKDRAWKMLFDKMLTGQNANKTNLG